MRWRWVDGHGAHLVPVAARSSVRRGWRRCHRRCAPCRRSPTRPGIERRKLGVADNSHLAAADPIALGADLRADQQAGEKAGAPVRCARRQQGRRAHLEQRRGQRLRRLDAGREAGLEARVATAGLRSGPFREWRSTEWVRSTSNSSPVMAVAKRSTRRPDSCTHLECVPGMHTTPEKPGQSVPSPSSCVSSPRITSSAPACRWQTPGRMRGDQRASGMTGATAPSAESAEVGRRIEIGRLHPALAGAGHAADQRVDARAGGANWSASRPDRTPGIGVGRAAGSCPDRRCARTPPRRRGRCPRRADWRCPNRRQPIRLRRPRGLHRDRSVLDITSGWRAAAPSRVRLAK